MSTIDVGELVRITNGDGFKTKPEGTLFDPATVELTVRAPDGTVTDLSDDVTPTDETSVGTYYADYIPTLAGRHRFKWNGDEVIEQGEFWVVPDLVSPEVGS